MSNVIPQKVVVIPNLATFQSTGIAGYQGSQAQIAYLQGTVTELDGGQGFYQLADNDFSTPSNPPTTIVDGAGNRWFYANVSLTAAAIIALLTGTPLPIVAGGTGQATAGAGLDALTIQGADIASAATVNLATATGEFVVVTGSTGPITALGTATAGIFRFVRFTGTPTLTHNATSLILPGSANITVAAGDTACFMSLGSGNWQCLFYTEIAGGTVGTLPVAQGGTGATTLTANGVLLGNGTSAVGATAVGATGTVLTGNTGAAPTYSASPTLTGEVTAASFAPSSTSGVIGTTTNNSAAAGSVGEYVVSTIAAGSAVAVTTGTQFNITSISLTAGDWDVSADVRYLGAAATIVATLYGSISNTSASFDTGASRAAYMYIPSAAVFTAIAALSLNVGPVRISLASTTTIYMVGLASFSVDTLGGYGTLRARRVR